MGHFALENGGVLPTFLCCKTRNCPFETFVKRKQDGSILFDTAPRCQDPSFCQQPLTVSWAKRIFEVFAASKLKHIVAPPKCKESMVPADNFLTISSFWSSSDVCFRSFCCSSKNYFSIKNAPTTAAVSFGCSLHNHRKTSMFSTSHGFKHHLFFEHQEFCHSGTTNSPQASRIVRLSIARVKKNVLKTNIVLSITWLIDWPYRSSM